MSSPAPYKPNVPSMALVACDGYRAIVIDWIGPELDHLFNDEGETVGATLDAFSDAPVGITVWRGHIDKDGNLAGEYKALSAEDWAKYKAEGSLWDDGEFYDLDKPISYEFAHRPN